MYLGQESSKLFNMLCCKTRKASTCCVAGGSTTEKRGMKEILVDECLKNPQTLLFAMSYFCVYVGTGIRLLVSEILVSCPTSVSMWVQGLGCWSQEVSISCHTISTIDVLRMSQQLLLQGQMCPACLIWDSGREEGQPFWF